MAALVALPISAQLLINIEVNLPSRSEHIQLICSLLLAHPLSTYLYSSAGAHFFCSITAYSYSTSSSTHHIRQLNLHANNDMCKDCYTMPNGMQYIAHPISPHTGRILYGNEAFGKPKVTSTNVNDLAGALSSMSLGSGCEKCWGTGSNKPCRFSIGKH